jgi:hypothetical protein
VPGPLWVYSLTGIVLRPGRALHPAMSDHHRRDDRRERIAEGLKQGPPVAGES